LKKALLIPRVLVPADGGWRSFEARAFTDLLRDDDASVWCTDCDTESVVPYADGYICFTNPTTDQCVDYSPQALKIYPRETRTLLLEGDRNTIATVVSGFVC
jgi:hypothetical protein